jgi:hypothetical protein
MLWKGPLVPFLQAYIKLFFSMALYPCHIFYSCNHKFFVHKFFVIYVTCVPQAHLDLDLKDAGTKRCDLILLHSPLCLVLAVRNSRYYDNTGTNARFVCISMKCTYVAFSYVICIHMYTYILHRLLPLSKGIFDSDPTSGMAQGWISAN